MKSLPVTQLFVQVNTHRTPSSREAERAMLDAALAHYTGPVEQLPAYQAKPLPDRRRWIDPEARPKHRGLTRAERELEQRAAAIVRRLRWHGMKKIREALNEAGIGMPPKRVELIAARHGILIAEGGA